ncbi:MAG TPA: hypothetical protein DIW47_03635 [Bacteroidetes bacterium]|nr:hypothetical protein [Bacteroidota bacterium]
MKGDSLHGKYIEFILFCFQLTKPLMQPLFPVFHPYKVPYSCICEFVLAYSSFWVLYPLLLPNPQQKTFLIW